VSSDGPSTSERALDLLVYGPLGLALYMRDTVPTFLKVFVARGKSEVDYRRRKMGDQVSSARSLGERALEFGEPVRQKIEEGLREARSFAEEAFSGLVVPRDGSSVSPGSGRTPPTGERAERGAGPGREQNPRRAESASLAIPDYDELSASQVVERLEGLAPDDLAAVRAYEEAHRGRRTILFKIDRLASD
jgi:hypothetical protein